MQRNRNLVRLGKVRRRKCRELSTSISDLAEHVGREDFVVCTYPILKRVNEFLVMLKDADGEGNAREILRQVRNTLMNGGWNKYRDPAVRQTATDVLNSLAEADQVLPQDVNTVFDRLYQAGLNPVGSPVFVSADEDETRNGQEVTESSMGNAMDGGDKPCCSSDSS